MTPDQTQLLRRLALQDQETTQLVMSGAISERASLDARTAALVRITALVSVDSDPSTFQWAAELGLAAGLDDGEVFDALVIVAPIIGMARLTAALPSLMSALDLEVLEG